MYTWWIRQRDRMCSTMFLKLHDTYFLARRKHWICDNSVQYITGNRKAKRAVRSSQWLYSYLWIELVVPLCPFQMQLWEHLELSKNRSWRSCIQWSQDFDGMRHVVKGRSFHNISEITGVTQLEHRFKEGMLLPTSVYSNKRVMF